MLIDFFAYFLGFVSLADINFRLKLRNDGYADASYMALLCLLGKSGLIDYFFQNTKFAALVASQETITKPMWLFQTYNIQTKVCFS